MSDKATFDRSSALGKNDPVALDLSDPPREGDWEQDSASDGYHPRRRRAVWFSIIRAEARTGRGCLPVCDALELVAEILEVVRADAQFPHFLYHGKEISQ